MKSGLFILLVFIITQPAFSQTGFGRVSLASNTDTLYLEMETVKLKISTKDTLEFPVGEYRFKVYAKGFRNRTLLLDVREGEMILLLAKLEPVHPSLREADRGSYTYLDWGKSLHVETDTDSRIEVNGFDMGLGQWMSLADTGWVDIRVTNPYGRTRTNTVRVREGQLTSVDMHVRMTRREHILNSFIPGLSPYRKQQYVRMVAAPLLVGALIQQSLAHQQRYDELRQEYRDARRTYLNAPPSLADGYAFAAQRKADQTNHMYRRRNLVYGLTVAGYVLTYLEGIRPGAIGYRQGGMRLDPYLESNPNGDGLLPAFRFAKSF